jgi:uncharacterized protein (DUF305 family)
MHILSRGGAALACGLVLLTTACVPARTPPATSPVVLAPGAGILVIGADGQVVGAPRVEPLPHTRADVDFMQGMIPHHAQAVRMSALVPTNTTSRDVLLLAERIMVSQRDEIALMQLWLGDRGERVPDSMATHHRHVMGGMEHDMLMPGMLSEEEFAQLAAARGIEFDRLFLTFMIRHHIGAIAMVKELFSHPGAGQEETVFRFATDVEIDQLEEIHRMERMLAARPAGLQD